MSGCRQPLILAIDFRCVAWVRVQTSARLVTPALELAEYEVFGRRRSRLGPIQAKLVGPLEARDWLLTASLVIQELAAAERDVLSARIQLSRLKYTEAGYGAVGCVVRTEVVASAKYLTRWTQIVHGSIEAAVARVIDKSTRTTRAVADAQLAGANELEILRSLGRNVQAQTAVGRIRQQNTLEERRVLAAVAGVEDSLLVNLTHRAGALEVLRVGYAVAGLPDAGPWQRQLIHPAGGTVLIPLHHLDVREQRLLPLVLQDAQAPHLGRSRHVLEVDGAELLTSKWLQKQLP